ncbi:hypothetical protein WJX72_011967 [[Myrmecia] bisecta]|uniref:FAS1 domain-containing protein n=1 Tax=[Myrmecia] bisecta TaxID=41462 RepID=A0AAW1PBG7_9CHLO
MARSAASVVAMLAVLAAACEASQQGRKLLQADTLASCATQLRDFLASRSDLSTVASGFGPLLGQLDLTKTPKATIFVPTDAALTGDLTKLAALFSITQSPDKLNGLALYYIVLGQYTPAQLVAKSPLPTFLASYTGKAYPLRFTLSGSGVTVTDSSSPDPASAGSAKLTDLNTTICNLKLMTVDSLLLPAASVADVPAVQLADLLATLYAISGSALAPAPGPGALAPALAAAAAPAPVTSAQG